MPAGKNLPGRACTSICARLACKASLAGALQLPDVSADGRFLMMERSQDEITDRLHVVLDWFEELKRLAPTD